MLALLQEITNNQTNALPDQWERNCEIYEQSLAGKTQKQIGEQFELTPQHISRLIRDVDAIVTRAGAIDQQSMRQRHLIQLEIIQREALRAWEQSADGEEIKKEILETANSVGEDANRLKRRDETTRRVSKSRNQFLQIALKAMEQSRNLAGVKPVEPQKPPAPMIAPFQDPECRDRFYQNPRAMFHAEYLQRFLHCPKDKDVVQLPIQVEYELFLIGRWIPMWQDRETGESPDTAEEEQRPDSLIHWDVIQRKHDPFYQLRKSEQLERRNVKRRRETMGEQEAKFWRGVDLPTAVSTLVTEEELRKTENPFPDEAKPK